MTNVTLHHLLPPKTPVGCDNCGWLGTADQLEEICDFQERVYPGETTPAGACPVDDCGACCHLIEDEHAPDPTIEDLATLLADNLRAWEDEEDSVQREHADLINRLRGFSPLKVLGRLTTTPTTTPRHYITTLERLWDTLSDTIEGGRITAVDCPDDYQALVTLMQECETARDKARWPAKGAPEPKTPPLKRYTVQCGFADYNACTVEVEAASVEEACQKACEEASQSPDWKRLDHAGDTYVDAIGEGDEAWDGGLGSALAVPAAFTEAALHLGPVERAARDMLATLKEIRSKCTNLAGPAWELADAAIVKVEDAIRG